VWPNIWNSRNFMADDASRTNSPRVTTPSPLASTSGSPRRLSRTACVKVQLLHDRLLASADVTLAALMPAFANSAATDLSPPEWQQSAMRRTRSPLKCFLRIAATSDSLSAGFSGGLGE